MRILLWNTHIDRRYLQELGVDLQVRLVRPEVVLVVELHDQEEVVLELDVRLLDGRVQLLPQSAALVDHYDRYGERDFDDEPIYEKGNRADAGRAVFQWEVLSVKDPHLVDDSESDKLIRNVLIFATSEWNFSFEWIFW